MLTKILIIGGNGLIGRSLSSYLDNGCREITNVVRNLSHESSNVKVVSLDARNTTDLIELAKDYDDIIWLVNNLVPQYSSDKLDDYQNNIHPIIELYNRSASLKRLKKFVFVSSGGTVYGNPLTDRPWIESDLCNPISDYGLSKLITENYIHYLSRKVAFKSVIIRPSNVYGPGFSLAKPQGIIGYVLNAIDQKKSIDLYDNGSQIRDFLYVGDFCEAIDKLLRTDISDFYSVYNLGSNQGNSIREIIHICENVTTEKLLINNKPRRDIDCSFNILDSSKFFRTFDFLTKTSLEQGILNTWNSIIKNDK